jgi:hypothetical protein
LLVLHTGLQEGGPLSDILCDVASYVFILND